MDANYELILFIKVEIHSTRNLGSIEKKIGNKKD